MRPASEWSSAEIAVLKLDWRCGLSAEQISRDLATLCKTDRSANSVLAKRRHLRLPARHHERRAA